MSSTSMGEAGGQQYSRFRHMIRQRNVLPSLRSSPVIPPEYFVQDIAQEKMQECVLPSDQIQNAFSKSILKKMILSENNQLAKSKIIRIINGNQCKQKKSVATNADGILNHIEQVKITKIINILDRIYIRQRADLNVIIELLNPLVKRKINRQAIHLEDSGVQIGSRIKIIRTDTNSNAIPSPGISSISDTKYIPLKENKPKNDKCYEPKNENTSKKRSKRNKYNKERIMHAINDNTNQIAVIEMNPSTKPLSIKIPTTEERNKIQIVPARTAQKTKP